MCVSSPLQTAFWHQQHNGHFSVQDKLQQTLLSQLPQISVFLISKSFIMLAPPPPTKMTLCMALPSQTHNTRSVFLRSWWHTGTGAVPRACSSPWGTLQDRDLDSWLHEIQLVTWFGRLGTRANTDSGYRTESTRSAWRFQGVGVVLGLKVPLRVTSSNLLL